MSDTLSTSDALVRVTALANIITEMTKAIAQREEEQRLAKQALRRVEEEDLPELMRELTLTEIRLEDGSAVKVSDEVNCSITVERKPAAHAWLVENGFGGLIKTELTLSYGRDQQEQAHKDALRIQKSLKIPVEVSEVVHPQTLKSFIKERLEAGEAPPTDLFGIHPFVKAKVTLPAAPKAPKVKKAK
jgi:hypothetical protein